jgi:hypothetical protein
MTDSVHNNPLLTAALHYASLGLPVFPLHHINADGTCSCNNPRHDRTNNNTGKHPLTRTGFKEASTDSARIIRWWTESPFANIGIATGQVAGVFVVDVDLDKGGEVTLAALPTLPPTLKVRTGGGGQHLWFKHPGGLIGNSVCKLGAGVDVRGDGGYVVAPPSTHRSGRVYVLEQDVAVAEAPPWLIEQIRSAPKSDLPPVSRERIDYGPISEDLKDHLTQLLAEMGPAIEGQSGRLHTHKVCATLVNDYALRLDEEAWPILEAWNRTCEPPWDESELEREMYGAELRATEPYGVKREIFDEGCEKVVVLKDPFIVAFQEALRTLEGGGWFKPRTRSEVKSDPFLTLAEIQGRPAPITPWLVRGIFPKTGVGVVSALPKCGKTWFLLEVAAAVASGTPAFGEFPVMTEGNVVLFAAEDQEYDIGKRLTAILATRTPKEQEKARHRIYIKAQKTIDVLELDHMAWFLAQISLLPERPVLVTLDPLVNVHTAEENDASEMAAVMTKFRALRDILGCAVVITHHATKSVNTNSAVSMRGSGAIWGSVDAGLYYEKPDTDDKTYWNNTIRVQLRNARGAGKVNINLEVEQDEASDVPLAARWTTFKDAPLEEDDDEGLDDVVMRALREGPKSTAELALGIKKRKITVERRCKDLAQEGIIRKDGKLWIAT